MTTHVVPRSGNIKIGPMAATYRTQESCPTSCPLLGNGCYAAGRIFSIARRFGHDDLNALRRLVDQPMPHGIRFNVSGDFLTADGTPDLDYIEACNEVARAHPAVPKIAYTHAWHELDPTLFDFTVNASCETVEDAEQAVAAGWQVALVGGTDGDVIGGKRVVTCLAQVNDITCADCRVCAADTRTRPIISFIPHGAQRKKVEAVLARNPKENVA